MADAVAIAEHQPVLALRIGTAIIGRLVAWAVGEAQQLSIELGQLSGVFTIQDNLTEFRHRRARVSHA